jgi:hypothetical protein
MTRDDLRHPRQQSTRQDATTALVRAPAPLDQQTEKRYVIFRVPRTKKEIEAFNREQAKWWRDGWLQAHPGRTAAEYNRLLRDIDSEV